MQHIATCAANTSTPSSTATYYRPPRSRIASHPLNKYAKMFPENTQPPVPHSTGDDNEARDFCLFTTASSRSTTYHSRPALRPRSEEHLPSRTDDATRPQALFSDATLQPSHFAVSLSQGSYPRARQLRPQGTSTS